ncbi:MULTISPECIES: hypothetical protein [Actinomyces]|nr:MULTISPECIES: hypothetical protein [Actinomyces]
MRSNTHRDTRPELAIRHLLHARGLRIWEHVPPEEAVRLIVRALEADRDE